MTRARSLSSWKPSDYASNTRTITRVISTSRDAARCSRLPVPLSAKTRVHPDQRPAPNKKHEEQSGIRRRLRASNRSDRDLDRTQARKVTWRHVLPVFAPPLRTSAHVSHLWRPIRMLYPLGFTFPVQRSRGFIIITTISNRIINRWGM